ncbi:MAG: FAD:protein FMN transferase, partial [Atribacterota bacterium]
NPLGHEVMIRGEGKIDLGGIAKGYLVDRMVLFLKSKGVSHALVNAGGTVYGWGRPFRVGIMHPRSAGLIGTVEIQDLAVSTSGDYFRFFEKEGFRYYHILNPYTGYPGRDFASVTIIDSNATEADVLSTAVMVGGKVFIPEVERRFPRVAIIGITAAGNITLNERARQIFHPLSSERLKK